MNENSVDIAIPAKLLPKLGLKHNIIRCPDVMDGEFARIYHKNVTAAHDVYGVIAQGLYNFYPQNKVCVKGNAIPIIKCAKHYFYRDLESRGETVSPQTLTKIIKVEGSTFAERHFEKWLNGSQNIYNIDLLDLFYWEIYEGNWQAMSQLEWDIVQEVFVPFNCRQFLVDMLSLDKKYRKSPECRLHRDLIIRLWPEILLEPINPKDRSEITLRRQFQRVKSRVKRKVKKLF
jgi:hypothetical protein